VALVSATFRIGAAAALAIVLAAGLGVGRGGAAATADVTLNVGHYRNPNGIRVTVFSGTVASNAAGEDVEVLGNDCGVKGFRLISATTTRAGGGWQVENPLPTAPWTYTQTHSGITYRARWKGRLSEPITDRVAAPLGAVKVGRLAWRVYTSPPPPGTVSMKGKVVLLQRLRGSNWVTTQRAKLRYKPRYSFGGAFNHEAVFKVKRGWTLRAVLPASSAAPCYAAAVSEEWRT